MRNEVVISGYGGQGILFSGIFLSQVGMNLNLFTTFFPSYGAEIRGGRANCHVILSDEEIGSPVIAHPSSFVILSQAAYDKYSADAAADSSFICNSTLVKTQNGAGKYFLIPATEKALELGDIKVANMLMLGAYLKRINLVDLEKLKLLTWKILAGKEKRLVEINLRAIETGYELFRES